MRATVMYKAGDVRIEHVPDASIQNPTDAVIRVTRACICGSDLWPYNLGPEPSRRRSTFCAPIVVKRNAWIGVGASVMPGLTIGKNAIVAANAVVTKDVSANTVVGGIPAKVITTFDDG